MPVNRCRNGGTPRPNSVIASNPFHERNATRTLKGRDIKSVNNLRIFDFEPGGKKKTISVQELSDQKLCNCFGRAKFFGP